MMTVAVLLFAIIVLRIATVFAVESELSVFKDLEVASIIKGTDADFGEIPWQVSLQTKDMSNHFCGGSIISSNWVLTAAHCIVPVSEACGKLLQIRAGTLTYKTGGTVHQLKKCIVYHGFNYTTLDKDIALIQVDPPFTFTERTKAVKELSSSQLQPGISVQISGWGSLTPVNASFNTSYTLKKVQVPVVTYDLCNEKFASEEIVINQDHQICAGFVEGGPDTCQGDSGGPMTLDGVLYGVVSWGIECGEPGKPGVYTKVEYFQRWIKLMTNDDVISDIPCKCDTHYLGLHPYVYVIFTSLCIISIVSLCVQVCAGGCLNMSKFRHSSLENEANL